MKRWSESKYSGRLFLQNTNAFWLSISPLVLRMREAVRRQIELRRCILVYSPIAPDLPIMVNLLKLHAAE
jgi:hypothetical protein